MYTPKREAYHFDDVRNSNAHSLGELGDSAIGANLEGRLCFFELDRLDFLGVA